jgi:4-oxalomesaconate tautomerase
MLARLEKVRREAGRLMGLGDVSKLVMPKFALVSPPAGTEGICSRYFTPAAAHTSHAVTGALCIAAACYIPGTVAARVFRRPPNAGKNVVIEHPAGVIQAEMDIRQSEQGITIPKAAFIRTAALLLKDVYHVR